MLGSEVKGLGVQAFWGLGLPVLEIWDFGVKALGSCLSLSWTTPYGRHENVLIKNLL